MQCFVALAEEIYRLQCLRDGSRVFFERNMSTGQSREGRRKVPASQTGQSCRSRIPLPGSGGDLGEIGQHHIGKALRRLVDTSLRIVEPAQKKNIVLLGRAHLLIPPKSPRQPPAAFWLLL